MSKYQALQQTRGRRPVPVDEWHEEVLEKLKYDFAEYLQLDLAESTRSVYNSQQRQYRLFCRQMRQPETPSPDLLAKFVVGRALHGYKKSTIEQGIAAVARWAAEQGQEGLAGHPLVKRALAVAAKLAVPGKVQKLPLDRQDLAKVVEVLRARGDFVGKRDAVMFLVGWAGMFRSSELVAIRHEHIHFTSDGRGVMIYVPSSKTDQAGEGAWVFIAGCSEQQQLCPVTALRQLGTAAGGSGAVFTAEGGSKALSKTTVGVRLHKALAAAGIPNWELYGAHSLRRGGATYAVQQGVSIRKIMIMGRWRSDVVREYLYAAPSEMWQAAQALQQ